MLANKIKLNSISGCYIEGFAFSARPFILMLITFILLLPLLAQADSLFDFQMKLAKKGNAEAQYKVGEMYETGFGVKQNKKEAKSWITKSANLGHETAGFKLLYWDMEKNGLKGKNKAKVGELKKKAVTGNPQAQYYLGKMHAHGVGVKKDPDMAIGWLNKAALVGVIEAETELSTVREDRQRNKLAKRRKEDKQVELKEREKRLKLEQQRNLQAQKKAEEKAKAKARADKTVRQKQAAVEAADKKAALLAKSKAEKKQREAQKKQREAQKQALLKKREVAKIQREQQFESDLCTGKSARFVSTCR